MLVTRRRLAVLGLVVGMIATASLFWGINRAASLAAPDVQQIEQQPRPPQTHPRDGAEGVDGDEHSITTGIVKLNFMGRLGNNLFEYATARALADRLGWALSLHTAPGNARKFGTLLRPQGMACFPGVRPVGPPATSPLMADLTPTPFRSFKKELADTTPRAIVMMDWFQDYKLFAGDASRLRQVRTDAAVLLLLLFLLFLFLFLFLLFCSCSCSCSYSCSYSCSCSCCRRRRICCHRCRRCCRYCCCGRTTCLWQQARTQHTQACFEE